MKRWLGILVLLAALGWFGQPSGPAAAQEEACPEEDAPIALAEDGEHLSLRVAVKGDKPVEAVLGPEDNGNVIVYLHGVCGDVMAFKSWVAAATKHATFISMRGEEKCDKRPGRHKWVYDNRRLEVRIDKAIAAVETLRQAGADSRVIVPLDPTKVVLVGYSQGAHRVESMARHDPGRFPRVVVIAPAREPHVESFEKSDRVVLMAGEKDAKQHIKDAYDKLKAAGKEVSYLELPGARHGEYGPEGERVMGEGFDWLYKARSED
jgi:predicted esterase